ncbi:hypothetical protein MPSEU_000907400 [Mayamaea pseudoterrestris]|nr:hypothetical protein MPSEU_000907400 [Mayamaea pseudoterrestris]
MGSSCPCIKATRWFVMLLYVRHSASYSRINLHRQLLSKRSFVKPFSCRLYAGSSPRKRKSNQQQSTTLEWERFEFGESPKWDDRFESSRTFITNNEEELQRVVQEEAAKDQVALEQINQHAAAWEQLSPDSVPKATELLIPYVKPDRLERIRGVLRQRTIQTSFLFENPSNPSNVWACLRTIESFGVQHVHVVIESGRYLGKAALSQKRGMRTAMGAAQWLTLSNYASAKEAVATLKRNNVRLYASDVNPKARDIRTIDWKAHADQQICIVMGNEERGISDEMRELVDETFYLPMQGFAESFNLSVATAITLAHLSAASAQTTTGPLRPGDLSKHEFDCLVLKGLLHSIAQPKVAYALLKKEGLELPSETLRLL